MVLFEQLPSSTGDTNMKSILLILILMFIGVGCTCCNSAPLQLTENAVTQTLFQFSQEADICGWTVEDDVVMGGRSNGHLFVNEAGNAIFTGNISLENNGGFSSIQYSFAPIHVSNYRTLVLGLKGDGKPYQLRVESTPNATNAYAFDFETSGDWQTIEIPLADMVAIHHGDRLDLPNYPGNTMAHIQLLIANDKAESFQLEIDRIWLK